MGSGGDQCSPLPNGGYECSFIDPPPDSLTCAICLLTFRDPSLVSCCGAKYCAVCIGRVKAVDQPCPLCKQPFDTMLDKGCQRAVLNLMVRCSRSEEGCDWKGELRYLDKHEHNECGWVMVACSYHCGGLFPRRELEQHEREECSKRPLDVKLDYFMRKMDEKFISEKECHIKDMTTLERVMNEFHKREMASLESKMKEHHVKEMALLESKMKERHVEEIASLESKMKEHHVKEMALLESKIKKSLDKELAALSKTIEDNDEVYRKENDALVCQIEQLKASVSNSINNLGLVFQSSTLGIAEEILTTHFTEGVTNIAAVSLQIGYPTVASVPHSIVSGFKNLLAVAVATDISFKEAEQAKYFVTATTENVTKVNF